MKKPQGGKTANISGGHGEQLVANLIIAEGFKPAPESEYRAVRAACRTQATPQALLREGQFYQQVPMFTSIYGVPFKADFIIVSASQLTVIEVKWQASAGSVDEKLPFWLMTLDALRDVSTALVILGDGQRPGVVPWCRNSADKTAVLANAAEVKRYLKTQR